LTLHLKTTILDTEDKAMDEKMNWRRLLGTAAVAGATALSPMKAHAGPPVAEWEKSLSMSWQQLSPQKRQELRQEERDWIKWKDKLPATELANALKSRAYYLQQFSPDPEAVAGAKERIQRMKDDGTWLTPETRPEDYYRGDALTAAPTAGQQPNAPLASIPSKAAQKSLPTLPVGVAFPRPAIKATGDPKDGRPPENVVSETIQSDSKSVSNMADNVQVENIEYGKPVRSTGGKIPAGTILYPVRVIYDLFGLAPNYRLDSRYGPGFPATNAKYNWDSVFYQDTFGGGSLKISATYSRPVHRNNCIAPTWRLSRQQQANPDWVLSPARVD
jgi:hypothetical protein